MEGLGEVLAFDLDDLLLELGFGDQLLELCLEGGAVHGHFDCAIDEAGVEHDVGELDGVHALVARGDQG